MTNNVPDHCRNLYTFDITVLWKVSYGQLLVVYGTSLNISQPDTSLQM